MKLFFAFFIASLFTSAAFATSMEEELFLTKEKFEREGFKLKLEKEDEMMRIKNKTFSSFGHKSLHDQSCVEWVYQGPSSREEAIAACRGVQSMECVEWVYLGPGSREEAAKACRGVSDMECVKFAYQGPGSRIEAAQSCGFGGRRPTPSPRDCHL